MYRASRLVLAFLLGTGVATVQPASRLMASPTASPAGAAPQTAALRPVAAKAPDVALPEFEMQAEQRLVDLANQSRHKSGEQPLAIDVGLSQAARSHALQMLQAQKLSHQFDGEPSLMQRVAAVTTLQLDQEGENVAVDFDADRGHEHLMLSAPHRANLLNRTYNVIGVAAIRNGERLYIVEDFGHALPNFAVTEWKNRVAAAVNSQRTRAHEPAIPRRELVVADDAACSMAKADTLGTAPVHALAQRFTVLTYTSLSPDMLPDGAMHAISSDVHSFSIGACYGRTETYPTGVYWVVLTLD